MLSLPSYTLITGHLFVLLSFCTHSSTSHHLLKFFYISSRLNTREVSCGYLWTVTLEELCSPSSSLHIKTWKENLSKSELQQEIRPYWTNFPFTGPLSLNSRVLDTWKICRQKIKESASSWRAWRWFSTPLSCWPKSTSPVFWKLTLVLLIPYPWRK